jgi:hypothetical protein
MRRVSEYLPKALVDRVKLDPNIAGYAICRTSRNPGHGIKEYARVQEDGTVAWVTPDGATLLPPVAAHAADCVAYFLGQGATATAIMLEGSGDHGEPSPPEDAEDPF